MQEYNIKYSVRSKMDIMNVVEYVTYDLMSSEAAANWLAGIRKAVRGLKIFPYKHQSIHKRIASGHEVYRMLYKNYNIYYYVDEQLMQVVILRIGYKKRNWIAYI